MNFTSDEWNGMLDKALPTTKVVYVCVCCVAFVDKFMYVGFRLHIVTVRNGRQIRT